MSQNQKDRLHHHHHHHHHIVPVDPLAPFQVQKATMADLQEISEFLLNDFRISEPLNASLGLGREESQQFFTDLVKASLRDGLSYIVRDPANNGRLVSVRLTELVRRDGQQNGLENGEFPDKLNGASLEMPFDREYPGNGKVTKICAILHAVEAKIWQLLPDDIHCVASWLVLSVSPDYKRRGIAQALLDYKLDELMECGCQGIITEASALNSQNLFKKLGYLRIYELPHSEWKDPESGEQVFKCKDGTDRVTLDFKPFFIHSNGKEN